MNARVGGQLNIWVVPAPLTLVCSPHTLLLDRFNVCGDSGLGNCAGHDLTHAGGDHPWIADGPSGDAYYAGLKCMGS